MIKIMFVMGQGGACTLLKAGIPLAPFIVCYHFFYFQLSTYYYEQLFRTGNSCIQQITITQLLKSSH